MVIDAKLPPQDPALGAPPPAYAPSPQDTSSRSAPQPQPQQYPPSAGNPYSPPPASSQWQNPGPGPQPVWMTGQQYRDQCTSTREYSLLSYLHYGSSVLANCARGQHEVVTSFGLCGIICAILLFPIGLIFLWWATTLVSSGCKSTYILCSIDTEKKCARCGVRLH
jgi:hypothetical protein